MAMKFRTPYTEMKPVFCRSGERFKVVYEMRFDEKGRKRLEAVGTTDVQAAIDAEFPSVDLNMILTRLVNGDEDALERAAAFYADVSEIPNNYRDILEVNAKAQKVFSELPEEIRKVYGNDYMQFLVDPERFNQVLQKREAMKVKEEANKEVIENDNSEQ